MMFFLEILLTRVAKTRTPAIAPIAIPAMRPSGLPLVLNLPLAENEDLLESLPSSEESELE
jgi:hypothetical protein